MDIKNEADSLLQIDISELNNAKKINQLLDSNKLTSLQPRDLDFVLNDPEFNLLLVNAVRGAASLNRIHIRGIANIRQLLTNIDKEIESLGQ